MAGASRLSQLTPATLLEDWTTQPGTWRTILQDHPSRQPRRGFLNPEVVRGISFWTASACVLVAVVACLLAIWQFTGTDALWRTVATCAVIGAGTIAFYGINVLFGRPPE